MCVCVCVRLKRFFLDINECAQEPSPCIGGVCINTQSSFRCVCGTGYELDASGLRCVGMKYHTYFSNSLNVYLASCSE